MSPDQSGDHFETVAAVSVDEVRASIAEAVKVHIDSRRQHGESVPPPTATTHTIHAA